MLVSKLNGEEAARLASFLTGGQEVTLEVDVASKTLQIGLGGGVKLTMALEEQG